MSNTHKAGPLYSDEPYQHVRVDLWGKNGSGALVAVDKFYLADHADISISGVRDWPVQMTVPNTGDADKFEYTIGQIVRLCGASFVRGQQRRSKELRNLLGVNP